MEVIRSEKVQLTDICNSLHRWNSSGEKIIWFCSMIIAKRLTVYETQNVESIWVEITIKEKSLECYLLTDLPMTII